MKVKKLYFKSPVLVLNYVDNSTQKIHVFSTAKNLHKFIANLTIDEYNGYWIDNIFITQMILATKNTPKINLERGLKSTVKTFSLVLK